VLSLAGRFNISDGLTLGGRLAWAEPFGLDNGAGGPGIAEGGMLEGSVGLAWRPESIDWLRLMVRTAIGQDTRPELAGPNALPVQLDTWVTGSVALMLDPIKYFQPTLVLTPWYKKMRQAGAATIDDPEEYGLLGMLRLGSQIIWGLGVAGEVRCGLLDRNYETTPTISGEGFEVGYGAEIFYLLEGRDIGALRFSVGYSFSDIPDPVLLLPDLRTGRKGVFVRLEGML
jgi:hypothetical protein